MENEKKKILTKATLMTILQIKVFFFKGVY